ncbi:MAG: hypothetical protein AB7P20_06985 [Rhizobiaceae bacterium]
MSAEIIRDHFVGFLGIDVAVKFDEPSNPRHVVLYRPDRLPDGFVTQAYEALATTSPDIAGQIERLLVSFETRLGRRLRRVPLPRPDRTTPTALPREGVARNG